MRHAISLFAAAALLWVIPPALAAEHVPHVGFDAELLTPLVLFNDSDFDRTEPAYNAERQHVGLVGTMFRPGVTFEILPTLRIRYQAEIGLNLWSRNNADQIDATADDIFLLLHKQVYAEGDSPCGKLGFKTGYDRWADPTWLMFAHWTGGAQLRTAWDRGRLTLDAGLLPDATFEGWQIVENNFTHDTFFGRLGVELAGAEGRFLAAPGANVLVDGSEVGRTLTLVAPYLHLGYTVDDLDLSIDLLGQFGSRANSALDGSAERQLAWGAQVHGTARIRAISLNWNVLALSPDDAEEGNGVNGGFYYSGFSRSPTYWLSENELVDLWNNLDERVGTRHGGHFLTRMGLMQGDLRVAWNASPSFEPALILGVAGALRPANALGHGFIGMEADLDLTFRHLDVLEFHLIGSVLVPGGAAAAAVNSIDREATDVQFGGMSMLAVRF